MLSRRDALRLGCAAALYGAFSEAANALAVPDYSLDIAPYSLDISAKHVIKTLAYNQQVPGQVLRFKEGHAVTIDVTNHTAAEEIVHWHGLFLPSQVDGSMEEGTPMIAPATAARYEFTARPAGFRWYHTHTQAGNDLKKGQYSGLHGFLMVDAKENPARYDREFFIALHDWDGQMLSSGDGSMNPAYNFSTINGKMLGFGEPLRVKEGERVLMHLLNSSATDLHWISLSGHDFRVVALDGNMVPEPQSVGMLRLAPAERVCAIVEMNNPGVWVLGEVRKHIQSAGMGIVIEYSDRGGQPVWHQPLTLTWNYQQFGSHPNESPSEVSVIDIPLVFESRFAGHGAPDHWLINGRSFPYTNVVTLREGKRYRLRFDNRSTDDHPVHLHRHRFEIVRVLGNSDRRGILKDVILVDGRTKVDVEFIADNPGKTLFHCHQQNHMDNGFMMLFEYV